MGSKFKIDINSTKCTGCLTCALHCSFARLGCFNPMKAYIRISTFFDKPNLITFTDECDNCGICARNCPYDALILEKITEQAA